MQRRGKTESQKGTQALRLRQGGWHMPEYDMIIRNGTIVDGTGRLPAYRGDVAIKHGKIAMSSGRIRASAAQELDATGCIIAPGAIDLHTHYDLQRKG